jgi:hypothetical protein
MSIDRGKFSQPDKRHGWKCTANVTLNDERLDIFPLKYNGNWTYIYLTEIKVLAREMRVKKSRLERKR